MNFTITNGSRSALSHYNQNIEMWVTRILFNHGQEAEDCVAMRHHQTETGARKWAVSKIAH